MLTENGQKMGKHPVSVSCGAERRALSPGAPLIFLGSDRLYPHELEKRKTVDVSFCSSAYIYIGSIK